MTSRRRMPFVVLMAAVTAAGLSVTNRAHAAPVAAPAPPAATGIHADPPQGEHALQEAQFSGTAPALTPDPHYAGRAGRHTIAARAAGVSPSVVAGAGRAGTEVFGFAPYWNMAMWQEWRYNLLSTVSYFGITYDATGKPVTNDGGYAGYKSLQLTDMIAAAHAQGSRVLLTVKSFNDADINSICSSPQNTQTAVVQAVNLVRDGGMDGVTVDFEGATSATYPNIQQCFTGFMSSMYSSFHQALPGSEVVVATYSGAASWDGGFMNIAALAPNTDAFFIMAYDMFLSGLASSNAPLNGPSYNDTSSVQQYLTKAPASKIILGVPYYGYKWAVGSPGINVPGTMVSGHNVDTYGAMFADLAGQASLSTNWDPVAANHYVQWQTSDASLCAGYSLPCWREMYYDDPSSLTQKYELVKNSGIRGMGIWALGFDSGRGELWDLIANEFTAWSPPTRLAVAGRGNHEIWTSAGSGVYSDTGGQALGAPAVTMQGGLATVVATGTDHSLWVRNDATGWAPLSATPVWCNDNPAVAVAGGVFTVSCIGSDTALWTASTTMPAAPGLPRVSGWTSLGGQSHVGPAVTQVGSSLTYFVSGTDGFVWTRTATAPWTRTNWRVLGHVAATTVGSTSWVAMVGADDRQIYYAASTTGNFALSIAGGTCLAGPGIAAYSANARIFCEAPDTSVWDGIVPSTGGPAAFEHDLGWVDFGAGAAA